MERTSTIQEAKQYLVENYDDGCKCPACGQFVKLYKRKLNSAMAKTLQLVYIHNNTKWVNVKDFLRANKFKNNHDWTLLSNWGLIEQQVNTESSKKTSGVWRVTEKGEGFIKNQVVVESHVFLYNNKLQGFSNTKTTMSQCLDEHFDYEELMKRNNPHNRLV